MKGMDGISIGPGQSAFITTVSLRLGSVGAWGQSSTGHQFGGSSYVWMKMKNSNLGLNYKKSKYLANVQEQ